MSTYRSTIVRHSSSQSQSCERSLGKGIKFTTFLILCAAGSALRTFFKAPEYLALLQTDTFSTPPASVLVEDADPDPDPGDPPPDSDSNKSIITKKLIHRDLPFNASSGIYNDPATTCGRERTRIVLKPFQDPGIFDFHTTVQTNLNILFVGSSIGVQFFTSFEKSANIVKSEVIRYGQGIRYRSNTQISLTPNGGTVGVLRVTGMFSMRNKDERQKMAPSAGGGWLTHDVRELRRMVNEWRPLESINSGFGTATSPCEVEVEVEVKNSNVTHSLNSTNSASTASSNSNATSEDKIIYSCEEKSFDIVVHQIATEWHRGLSADKVVNSASLEDLADTTFVEIGASTLILQTIAINNNAVTLSELVTANRRIWEYAIEFEGKMKLKIATPTATTTAASTSKKQIFVMDLFAYSITLFLHQSMEIGIISRDFGAELSTRMANAADYNEYLNLAMSLSEAYNHTLGARKAWFGGAIKVGHYCAEKDCKTKSIVTADGIHWCIEEMGERMNAAIACLSQCSLKKDDINAMMGIRQCEKHCNDLYMNIVPVTKTE